MFYIRRVYFKMAGNGSAAVRMPSASTYRIRYVMFDLATFDRIRTLEQHIPNRFLPIMRITARAYIPCFVVKRTKYIWARWPGLVSQRRHEISSQPQGHKVNTGCDCLPTGYQGLSPTLIGRTVKLATCLYIMAILKMHGSLHSFPHTSSPCDASSHWHLCL